MQKILIYEDKVALETNPNIPNINKITDDDMNEIKSVVNGSLQGTNAMGSIVVDDINCKNICDGVFESGNINDSGVETTSTSTYRSVNYYEVIGGQTYIASYNATTGTNLNWVACYDANKTFITRITNVKTDPFTLGSTVKYIRIGFYNSGGISAGDFSNVQVEKGNTSTTYVPYNQPVKQTSIGVKESCTFYADDFKCKNLFNKGAVPSSNFGYRLDTSGGLYADTDYFASYYIKVNPGTTYTLNYTPEARTRVCFYNSSKTFISKNDTDATFTTPNNCEYIRFGYLQAQLSNIQLEIGSVRTTFTPFKEFENNDLYSTSEVLIGTWIDRKPIYRKVVSIGDLPSNTSKTIDISSLNIDFLVDLRGMAKHVSNSGFRPLPLVAGGTGDIRMDIDENGKLRVQTYASWSGFNPCYAYLDYTKTTDTATRGIETSGDDR